MGTHLPTEKDNIKIRPLLYGTLGIFVLMGIAMLVVLVFPRKTAGYDSGTGSFGSRWYGEPAVTQEFPEPRLQRNDTADMNEYRTQEMEVLNSYAWVDRGNGTVRVPIERAMQLLLKQGLPTEKRK